MSGTWIPHHVGSSWTRALGGAKEILEYTDWVLFDIKHMDPATHKELTGADHRLILGNAKRILQQREAARVRIPLIPGGNDSEEDVRATGEFIIALGLREIDLLPSHWLGIGKYERLGKEYKLIEIHPYREEEAQKIERQIESLGISVSIA